MASVVLPGAGAPIAVELIAAENHQLVKMEWGAAGVATPVSAAAPLPVSGPLTDAQLRATAVPVSAASLPLPAGAATETTAAGIRTDIGTDGSAPPPVLGAGTGVRGWLRSIYEKLTGTLAVTGAFFQATQPVSIATNTPDVTDRAARLLGVVASITGALPTGANTLGALTANQSVNKAQIAGTATAVGSGVSGLGVQRVVLATDVIQPAVSELRAATLHVTATAVANTATTASLPAAGAGLFHYITAIHLQRNATAALAGTATLIHTSANLPGSPAWSVGNAMAAGGTQLDLDYRPTTPLRAAVANTITSVTMVAGGAAVLNRINISYFTAA